MFKKNIAIRTEGTDEEICVLKFSRKEYNELVERALSLYIETALRNLLKED